MRIFLDSTDIETINKLYSTGLIDGVTTNPTLIRKSGKDPRYIYDQLALFGIPDISMEVSGSAGQMYDEGKRLAMHYSNKATIKLPMTQQGLVACAELSDEGIRTNITLVFTPAQAILATKAGATYVSPFVGRVDDQGFAGLEVVRSICDLYARQRATTEVLAASIRTVQRAVRSFYNGADIVTMPPNVFEDMYKHVLTDKGIQIFENDLATIEKERTLDSLRAVI